MPENKAKIEQLRYKKIHHCYYSLYNFLFNDITASYVRA